MPVIGEDAFSGRFGSKVRYMTEGADSSKRDEQPAQQARADTEPDRSEVPELVGQHSPLVSYPATKEQLIAAGDALGVPPKLMESLHRLPPGTTFANAHELWSALD